jgi:predicted membrane-bound mannosyltransferase
MDSERLHFPQYLHRPFRIGWFESDELLLMIAMYLIAVVSYIKVFFAIPVVIYLYKKEKARRPRGFMRHFLFNLGFIGIKGYPSAFCDRFEE